MQTRVLTGITTTGTPHLGNYAGAIRPAIAASQRVIARLAPQRVIADAADQSVIAGTAVQVVSTIAAIERVGAVAANQCVVTSAAVQCVGLAVADQGVAKGRTGQALDAQVSVTGRVAGVGGGIGQAGQHAH